MGGRGSPVGTTKIRFVPSVACESLLLLRGVQRLVGVVAVGVIGKGSRIGGGKGGCESGGHRPGC